MISIDLRFIYYLDAKVQLFGDKRQEGQRMSIKRHSGTV
jgi:hypothetical protein